MSYSRRSRYEYRSDHSRSPYRYSRSVSRSSSRSRSRSRSGELSDVENPGNNLYVTGLSSRLRKNDLEKHFASEGKVIDVHLVVDPWTRESRGFGFVTMDTVEEANRCIKYLDRSVLEGRVISVEKARRRRGRTPTPGRYLGVRTVHVRRRSPSYSPYHRGRYRSRSYSSERDRSYSPYYSRRSYSPPYYSRRSYSPYYRRRSYSPYHRRYWAHSRSRSPYGRYSRSPIRRRGHRSYSRDSRSCSSERSVSPRYRRRAHRYVSRSRSISPRVRRGSRRGYSGSVSPRRRSRRSYSRSYSPRDRRSRRSYSRSYSPRGRRSRRSCSPGYPPIGHKTKRSPSCSISPRKSRRYSRESYSHSRGMSYSRSVSSSPARSTSP